MAVEVKDGKKILVTPISAEDLKDIHIGDMQQSCTQVLSFVRWEMRSTRWFL